MGQKVHPIGFRLGVTKTWSTRWCVRTDGKKYGEQLLEDFKIREYLEETLEGAEISRIEIDKAGEDNVKITVHSARPGVVIGKKGQEIEALRKELAKILGHSNIEVSVQQVKAPELDAKLVAKNIAEQLLKRVSFKQAMNRAASVTIKSGAKGIKIRCAGRLGGAEIARDEWTRKGSIPLQTLRSDIDYGFAEAKTTYGIIGVKVWIYKGEISNK